MKKLLFASIFALAFCFVASRQDSPCPTISLIEPESVPKRDENMTFTVIVNGRTENLKLEYFWVVDKGKIVEGQGTTSVTIGELPPDNTPTVTVEIKGLPEGCENTVSGTAPVCSCIKPRLLGELKTSAKRLDKALFNGFITELTNEPTSTAYIIIYTDVKTSTKKLRKKEQKIRKYFSENNFPLKRVFMMKDEGGGDSIRLFIVPQGAEPPTP